ncbi:hypothetical protein IWW38_004520, partial [Coemansia aciculifera]
MRNKKPAAYRPPASAALAQSVRAAGRQANSVSAPVIGVQQPACIGLLKEGREQYQAKWRDRHAQFETAWVEREAQYVAAWSERRTRFEAAWQGQQAQVEAALAQQQTLFEAMWSEKQTLYQSAWDEQQVKFDAAWKERHAHFETVWREQQAQYESSWKERQAQIEAALKLVTAPTRLPCSEASCACPHTASKQKQPLKGATERGLNQLQKHSATLQAKFSEPLEKYTELQGSQDFATAATQEHNNVQSMFADLALQNSESSKQALGKLSRFSEKLEPTNASLPDMGGPLAEPTKPKPATTGLATSTAISETLAAPCTLEAVPTIDAAEANELKAQISL